MAATLAKFPAAGAGQIRRLAGSAPIDQGEATFTSKAAPTLRSAFARFAQPYPQFRADKLSLIASWWHADQDRAEMLQKRAR